MEQENHQYEAYLERKKVRHQNYIKNREKLLSKSRIYYENNKDKRKVYYQNNKEKRIAYANERYRKLKAKRSVGDNFLI